MSLRTEFINIKARQGKKIFKSINYPPIPLSIDDIYVITSEGDRLDLLANLFYKNVDYWWIIVNANNKKRYFYFKTRCRNQNTPKCTKSN